MYVHTYSTPAYINGLSLLVDFLDRLFKALYMALFNQAHAVEGR